MSDNTSVQESLQDTLVLTTDVASAMQHAPLIAASGTSLLDLPAEVQKMIVESLYITGQPWGVILSSNDSTTTALFSEDTCPTAPLLIPELQAVAEEVFNSPALPKSTMGVIILLDSSYGNLIPADDISLKLRTVSKSVQLICLNAKYALPLGTDDFRAQYPNLRYIRIEDNDLVRKYWDESGIDFSEGEFVFPRLIIGQYDDVLESVMSDALDELLPPSRCQNSQDLTIHITIGITGDNIQGFSGPDSRLGAGDVLAIDFEAKNGEVRIVQKWMYVVSDWNHPQESYFLAMPFGPWAIAYFRRYNFDPVVRDGPGSGVMLFE